MTKVNFKTLQKRIASERIKSATKLSAQSRGLCSSLNPAIDDIFKEYNKYNIRNDLIDIEKAVIELLMLNGLRISEVLNIKPTDVLSNGFISIKGLKNSKDRLVRPVFYGSKWRNNFTGLLPLKIYYSRYYFYRLFKKIGIYAKYGNNVYNSLTHYFRHEIVISMRNSGVDDRAISDFLGHKSMDSLKYYTNEKK